MNLTPLFRSNATAFNKIRISNSSLRVTPAASVIPIDPISEPDPVTSTPLSRYNALTTAIPAKIVTRNNEMKARGSDTNTEQDLKAELLRKVIQRGRIGAGAVISNEYRLGDSGIRADLAILGSSFIGVEVKSAHDSLRRLPKQLSAYRRYFDRVIVLLAEKHLLTTPSDLSDVELWVETARGSVIRVHGQKEVQRKSSELIDLLPARYRKNLAHGVGGNLETRAKSIRRTFEDNFRAKFGYTSSLFWSNLKDKELSKDSLRILSGYQPEKLRSEEFKEIRAAQLSKWKA